MNPPAVRLRHAILGAGGVGGLMAACLAKSGAPVSLVVRRESLATYPRQLRLESPFGNFSIPVERVAEVSCTDVLWLAVKATQLESSLAALTHPESVKAIVPLLNGIDHIPWLRSKYGAEKIIPATIGVESERVAPGHIIHRSSFVRLNVSSAGRTLLAGTLEQLRGIGFDCHFVDDEATMMWNKLAYLAAFALTSTASGLGTKEILSDAHWSELGLAVIREACAVGKAEGAKVDGDSVIAVAMRMPDNMRSSMQKDVEQGNPPELDAIAGPILRGAGRHCIEVPATKSLVEEVERRSAVARSN